MNNLHKNNVFATLPSNQIAAHKPLIYKILKLSAELSAPRFFFLKIAWKKLDFFL